MISFGSDNHSGAHPDVIAALNQANVQHTPSYGQDPWSAEAERTFVRHFGECDVFFVFNGTAANVLAIGSMLRSHQSVLCSERSHLNIDECGAPERILGCKLLPLPHQDGKIAVESVERCLIRRGDQHFAQPRVLSLTQPTELGTLYTPSELQALCAFAHQNGLLVHMDGARLVNAAASLDLPLAALTRDVGVDALSFGGTKNGLVFGEAVVLFNKDAARDFRFLRKQTMQLMSKARFVAAQFQALLSGELWLQNARHALAMARRLEASVRDCVKISRPVQSNAVFAVLPWPAIKRAREEYFFYVWDEHSGEVRWMTSFDTTEADVDGFAGAIRRAVAGG